MQGQHDKGLRHLLGLDDTTVQAFGFLIIGGEVEVSWHLVQVHETFVLAIVDIGMIDLVNLR